MDTLLIPMICLGAEGMKRHHTTGNTCGPFMLPVRVRSVRKPCPAEAWVGDLRSVEHSSWRERILVLGQACTKASHIDWNGIIFALYNRELTPGMGVILSTESARYVSRHGCDCWAQVTPMGLWKLQYLKRAGNTKMSLTVPWVAHYIVHISRQFSLHCNPHPVPDKYFIEVVFGDDEIFIWIELCLGNHYGNLDAW